MAPVLLHGNLLRVGAVGEIAHEALSSCLKIDSEQICYLTCLSKNSPITPQSRFGTVRAERVLFSSLAAKGITGRPDKPQGPGRPGSLVSSLGALG